MSTSNEKPKQSGYNKNKTNNRNNHHNHSHQPCRGFPAIFFTCESGRERKCQKEALELIHHYYYLSKGTGNNDDVAENDAESKNDEPLSLDEELKLLRKGAAAEEVLSYERKSKRPRYEAKSARSMKSPFLVHDVGMKGMVCVVFTLPGSELIPYNDIVAALRPKDKAKDDDGSDGKENCANEQKDDKNKDSDNVSNSSHQWDPIETVRIIMKEVGSSGNGNKNDTTQDTEGDKIVSSSPPGSRFVSRMIPIQATCHASLNEIKAVTKALLKNYLDSKNDEGLDKNATVTFKIDFKRRNCSHLSRDQIFEAVVPLVMGEANGTGLTNGDGSKQKYAVNLTDPDFSIRIEVCKTFCGVSILPRQSWYGNFNLAELCDPSSRD